MMSSSYFHEADVDGFGATGAQGRAPVAPCGEPDPDWQPL
jgi:hypothetical protein